MFEHCQNCPRRYAFLYHLGCIGFEMLDAISLFAYYSEPLILMIAYGYVALYIIETPYWPWMPYIVRRAINIFCSIAGFIYFLNFLARIFGSDTFLEGLMNAPRP